MSAWWYARVAPAMFGSWLVVLGAHAQAPAAAPESSPAAPSASDAPPPPPAAVADDTRKAAADGPAESWPWVQVHGRVMAGYELERTHPKRPQMPVRDGTEPGFFLDQARVRVEAETHERLRAVVSMELSSSSPLRNAYLNYKPEKELQFRLGRFRRPLSWLSTQSIESFPFRRRGMYDDLIMEDQQWGDRALGFMVHGKPVKRVRYYAAVMSPAVIGSGIEGADVIARLEYKPVAMLELGLGAAHKWTERYQDGPNLSMNAVSANVALEVSGFYAAIEGTAAENPNPPKVGTRTTPRTPWAVGVLGYAGYYAEVAKDLLLGPVAVIEGMDTDTAYGQDERLRGVFGVSLTFEERHLRVMPQVEVIRPLGNVGLRSQVAEETYYVLVSAGF